MCVRVHLYSSATNRLISAKDHAAVQINVGHVDENGIYIKGDYTTFALSGFIRKMGQADQALNRLVMQRLLQRLGFEHIETVDGGVAALHRIEDEDFGLIVMDIQMPDLDGFETTRRILGQSGSRAPVIVACSAHALTEYKEESVRAGMRGFVPKPVTLDSLREFFEDLGDPEAAPTR